MHTVTKSRKRIFMDRMRRTASRIRKAIKPKTYDDYKREMRETRRELELTGHNKGYWRSLAKLIGKEKAERRRRNAIEMRLKVRCADKDGVIVEVTQSED